MYKSTYLNTIRKSIILNKHSAEQFLQHQRGRIITNSTRNRTTRTHLMVSEPWPQGIHWWLPRTSKMLEHSQAQSLYRKYMVTRVFHSRRMRRSAIRARVVGSRAVMSARRARSVESGRGLMRKD